MERIGYDTRMRGIRTIDEVHVHPGEDGIGSLDKRLKISRFGQGSYDDDGQEVSRP